VRLHPPYRPPGEKIRFGDIFEADFMIDLFAREDAVYLGGGRLEGEKLIQKLSKWLSTELPAVEAAGLYSALFAGAGSSGLALAHASPGLAEAPRRAILLSDTCAALTALAQDREGRSPSGRLLFASVRDVGEQTWERLRELEWPDYGRCPLPACAGFEHQVAELRHLFMVDARRLVEHLGRRIGTLGEEDAQNLEDHWGACSLRRGPIAFERNAQKLAVLLAGGEESTAREERVADAIAEVLERALQIEAGDFEAVSDAVEKMEIEGISAGDLRPSITTELEQHLRQLAGAAGTAADELAAVS
jgi:hypothetical protein